MNFVFFIPDELRAESVGCFSPHAVPEAITPHISRLAAGGTRFDDCHVQHTVCTPSRCSHHQLVPPRARAPPCGTCSARRTPIC